MISLSPRLNRTAYYWHIHVEGISVGQRYAYRIQGPWRPYGGTRFDAEKVLLDPYGRSIELGANYDRWTAACPGSNLAFFAPHAQCACGDDPLTEFRDMVKALHKANIEVILDVVYNHTAEGGDDGPIFSFRGIDNEAYYILDNNQKDTNYSSCGNTFNGAHPVALRMIMDSLHFWRQEMHVDGFRFDLAAILSRDESGQPQANAPPCTP